jgi:trehalose synthase
MTENGLGEGRRRALAVVTGTYRHEELSNLVSPPRDAEMLKRVLGNPSLGGFDSIETILDGDVRSITNKVYDFFQSADERDLLFVYFSCHGRRQPDGRLYLTTIETDPNRLPPTAIPADFIAEQLDSSPAGRAVLVIDSCHAGAFTAEPRSRANRDRIIILTSSSAELAHEGEDRPNESSPSAFASVFFEGIESGRADNDGNGLITVREAFDYAVAGLRTQGARQTPQMRAGITGDLVLCLAPLRPGQIAPEVESLIDSSLPEARLVGIDQLGRWLNSVDRLRVKSAEDALARLRRDSNERVAQAASRLLALRPSDTRERLVAEAPLADPLDPLWFKSSVFYDVQMRSFADGNGDGVGDIRGLMERLEYLQWLGVDALILSPIFDSPLLAGSDDISDFLHVHPQLGSVNDLVEFLDSAHRRSIRVLLDLVLNHTSSRHPWFEESRRAPESRYGNYYVWSDSNIRFAEASRTADTDDVSMWTYDPVRGQYYWHRFGPAMPDLNFDSPAVQGEISQILRYWLNLGVDGFRLISAPYLFERDGTACEGLDETHTYLRSIRAELAKEYPGRILMAGADRWPSEARDYFGDPELGPECHMVHYASLMPRIFLAMRRETRLPVSTLLQEADGIREDCEWGIYLRNGAEMSLEIIKPPDRDYLLDEYAPRERMRLDGGIRRRLMPLLDGDRAQLELCYALLLSLPGAPILYYGDEIGMGDNLTLPGLAAIRTPMQWSAERGSGFSSAEPDELVYPLITKATYGYESVNVAAQRSSRASQLAEIQRLIAVRRNSQALTQGTFIEVASSSRSVFAYLRRMGEEQVLCVNNFSAYPRSVSLEIPVTATMGLVEISGGSDFGQITGEPYRLALGGHGYLWFRLIDSGSA